MKKLDPKIVAEACKEKEFTIGKVTYKILTVPHKKALKVVGYSQRLQDKSLYIGDPGWNSLEELLGRYFSIDGTILMKDEDHFNNHPENYMTFIAYAIGVITYPFLKGTVTG